MQNDILAITRRAAWLSIVMLGVCGCSPALPPLAKVTGKVTFKNEPVVEGTIFFIEKKSGSAGSGQIGPDGKFKAIGKMDPGTYVVFLQPPIVEDAGNGKTAPRKVLKEMESIPPICRTEQTSPLTAQLPADGELVFELGDLPKLPAKSKKR